MFLLHVRTLSSVLKFQRYATCCFYLLKDELKRMYSKTVNSVLCSNSHETLKSFEWTDLITELTTHAPNFTSILKSCSKTKANKGNTAATMGACAAVLLKNRDKGMGLVQKKDHFCCKLVIVESRYAV